MPKLSINHGLIYIDSLTFHKIALEQYHAYLTNGWSSVLLYPQGQLPAGITSIIYIITNIAEPWILFPFHACICSLGCLALFKLLKLFNVKEKNAFLSSTLPALLPSQLLVIAQPHRDLYFMVSFWSFLLFFFRIYLGNYQLKDYIKLIFSVFAVIFFRDYLFLPIALSLFCISIASLIFEKPSLNLWKNRFYLYTLILLIAGLTEAAINHLKNSSLASPIQGGYTPSMNIPWQNTWNVPPFIDEQFKKIASKRSVWLNYKRINDSTLNDSLELKSTQEVIFFIPKAFLNSLLAPYPNLWVSISSNNTSLMRIYSAFEMLFYYFCIFFLFFTKINGPKKLLLVYFFGLLAPYLLLLGLITPNVGSLFRIRIAFYLPIICIGLNEAINKIYCIRQR